MENPSHALAGWLAGGHVRTCASHSASALLITRIYFSSWRAVLSQGAGVNPNCSFTASAAASSPSADGDRGDGLAARVADYRHFIFKGRHVAPPCTPGSLKRRWESACVNVEAKELKHLDVSLLALRVYWDKSQQTCTFLRCILEMTHVTGSRPLAVFLLDTPTTAATTATTTGG